MKPKACPFCGKIETVGVDDYVNITGSSLIKNTNFMVNCDYDKGGCGACGGCRQSKEKAIEVWNERKREIKK